LAEENEPNLKPERSIVRRWPAAASLAWVWLFCSATAVVVIVLLVASLPYAPWHLRSSANRPATAATTAKPSPAPAAPAAAAGGTSHTIFAWRDGAGVLRRAGIASARYNEFVAASRHQIDADQQALTAARGKKLRAELAPVFDEIDGRVSGYADWVFDWWTSWILLARTFGWTWDDLTTGPPLSLPDRVQAKLVAAVQQQFIGRVLEPSTLEPKIDAALDGALLAMRDELRGDCAKYQQSFSDFIRSEARQVERHDAAQGWIPDGSWEPGAATFQPLCDQAEAIDEAALRAQFPVLLELKAADSPVNDVILRLARPFATKLISFVVLPVIIAAVLGGILLPLFSQLPGVLANVVTGVLTGAFGALIIGLGASASVDWLLNRTDATLNRAGFEASVRKAIISAEHDFETRVLDAQQRPIDRQMQALASEMAGKITVP
jgi:hypothetical protein